VESLSEDLVRRARKSLFEFLKLKVHKNSDMPGVLSPENL
jgi:hypothetical protein